MRAVPLLLALAAFKAVPQASAVEAANRGPNPIRKVVTLLQAMQKKVEEEGEKELELYEKFACYCKSAASKLSKGIAGAETKAPSLEADIKSAEEQKAQLEADVKQAKVDREQAKQAIAEATALREKQAADFAAYKAEADTNIAAIKKAVAALERGASGGFLQTGAAGVLKGLVGRKQDMADADRQEVLAFLQGGSSGEVTGILQQMGEEMEQGLADATAAEQSSISAFEGLVTAKKKELEALTEAVETKTERIGELAVSVVQMKKDLEDLGEALVADREFLANLESSCATKKKEWEERQKTRSEELAALADTIKLLNDDDALDLFKNTLPGSAASFLQMATTAKEMRAEALAALRAARRAGRAGRGGRTSVEVDRIVLALHGKQGGFEKVIQLIDAMVATLKKEQVDDEHKKEYCAKEFDAADDKKKDLERAVADAETAIAKSEDAVARLGEEVEVLQKGIKDLDKSVAEATEQRKTENAEYTELIASNSAAKELLTLAKNRLNKFYNPSLVSLVQVSASVQHKHKEAPGAAPETFGEYGKKSEESSGVIAMIDMLIQDLDKEMTEAGAEEKNSQKDYEKLMKDSAEKRTADSKALTQKEASKADIESQLQTQKGTKVSTSKDLEATNQYIEALHSECDWLLQYFDTRTQARTAEIDSLDKAKAVLSGASFSLVQVRTRRGLLVRKAH